MQRRASPKQKVFSFLQYDVVSWFKFCGTHRNKWSHALQPLILKKVTCEFPLPDQFALGEDAACMTSFFSSGKASGALSAMSRKGFALSRWPSATSSMP